MIFIFSIYHRKKLSLSDAVSEIYGIKKYKAFVAKATWIIVICKRKNWNDYN